MKRLVLFQWFFLIAHIVAMVFGLAGLILVLPHPEFIATLPSFGQTLFQLSMTGGGVVYIVLGALTVFLHGYLSLGLRSITLFFVPLEPPSNIIPLHDEFLTNTFYAGSQNLKDLFFSGHAATLFLFYFFATNKILKYVFLVAAISVSIGVVMQHVHYSYDVIAAPIFAYIAYRFIVKFSKHYYNNSPEITV